MQLFRLVNKKGETVFQGSYEQCKRREKDVLEYVGVSTPIYRATDNNGLCIEGEMQDISDKLGIPVITLYNYTRYARKKDGLYVKKLKEEVIKD